MNRVLLVLAVGALAAAWGLAFLTVAPNRLVTGTAISLAQIAGAWGLLLLLPATVLVAGIFLPQRQRTHAAVAIAATLLLFGLTWLAGVHAARLAETAPATSRTSFGGGFWLLALIVWLAAVDAIERLRLGPVGAVLAHLTVLLPIVALLLAGELDQLSVLREYATRKDVFHAALGRHIEIVVAALLPTLVVGIPLGIALFRRAQSQVPVFAVLNVIQTIPSIALFGLLMVPLALVASAVPGCVVSESAASGWRRRSSRSCSIRCCRSSRSTVAGLGQVPRSVVEAATGMGLSRGQIFRKVELPIALPVFLSGLRIAAVQAVGPRGRRRVDRRRRSGRARVPGPREWRARPRPARRHSRRCAGGRRRCDLPDPRELSSRARRMIAFEHVGKSFDGRVAIDDLSLTIDEGEFVVVIGRSGSGKSTTLKMVNRLVEHDRGRILFAGEEIRRFEPEALRRRMGYAIQSIGLFPHWTVEQNIATVPDLLRLAARARSAIASPSCWSFCISHRKRFAAVIRTSCRAASSSGSAWRGRWRAIRPCCSWTSRSGRSIPSRGTRCNRRSPAFTRRRARRFCLVTHDIDEALRLATRIVLLDHGRLVQVGTAREILSHPASDFVTDFVGRSDIGIKLLGLDTVAAFVRPGETAAGEPIALSASLREALSTMIARRVDRLPVVDGEGRTVGAIVLTDLVQPRP